MMISDEMLKQAATELAMAMNESLPDPEECTHQFSPEFEKKIKRITRRANHPILYRSLRNVASVLLVIAIGFGSVLAISPEVRAAVFGWVKEQYQSLYEYFFEGDSVPLETATYYLGWLPEGCEFVTSYETSGGEVYIYSTRQNSIVQFSYISEPDDEKMYTDGVEIDTKSVIINGCPGEIYISQDEKDTNSIIWTDTSQMILFSIYGNYDEETLVKMAENILKK